MFTVDGRVKCLYETSFGKPAINSILTFVQNINIKMVQTNVAETVDFYAVFIKGISLVLIHKVTFVFVIPFKKRTISLTDVTFVA